MIALSIQYYRILYSIISVFKIILLYYIILEGTNNKVSKDMNINNEKKI